MEEFGRKPDIARKEDARVRDTFTDSKYTILVVTRTLTSAYRALEAVQWFRDDFRIKLVFTVDNGSDFSTGVHDLLRGAGVKLLAWERVTDPRFRYQLALTASENIDFEAIDAHTVLLPHGLGFNKLVPAADGSDRRLAGLPSERALRSGKVTIALSHPEQRAQLLAASADTIGRTEIVGDPTFDRLRISRDLRSRYRSALDTGDRTLVAVASTWRQESVIGRSPTLPARLLSALPADSYQVVVILHPNIWADYGELQIKVWLSSALDAGLILMPPESGWHAGLIASDQVISDHGSLGLFAAALDKPLLMIGRASETVPGTPAAALADAVAALRPDDDLHKQLDDAREHHRAGQFEPITSRVFAHVDDATHNIQNLIYGKLDLTPLAAPTPLTRIPIPDCDARPILSYIVRTATVTDATLPLVRFPASVWLYTDAREHHETHLVAEETEPDPKIIERAAAVTRDLVLDPVTARSWGQSTLSFYPGARLAVTATPEGCLAVLRDGMVVRAAAKTESPDVQLVASAIYCCLIARDLPAQPLTICAGAIELEVAFTVDRRDGSATP